MKLKKTLTWRTLAVGFSVLIIIGHAAYARSADEDYNGVYSGTLTGDEDVVWVAVIDNSADSVFLTYSTETGDGDGGYLDFKAYDDAGNFWGWLSLSDVYADAYIDLSDDSVSGFWDSPTGRSGTIAGNALTAWVEESSYVGTFQGDSSGDWLITIQSDGFISGSMITDDGTFAMLGGCHPDGYVVILGQDTHGYHFICSGLIDGGAGLSGRWISESGDQGTFSSDTAAVDGDSGSGGGSGGGGCFIRQLNFKGAKF